MTDLHATIAAVKTGGRQLNVRCPAHEDSRASLSVGLGADGRVLLKCQASCETSVVLEAAGLTWSDVCGDSARPTKPQIVATYVYRDEGGAHLFDVCRFAPKDFRQRRADGVWSMKGVRRVLYRLDKLQGTTTAYIVEGEKDADRLWTLGLPATTAPGGAGKWRDEYAAQLKAAAVENVVILTDNDDPGREGAEQAARACHAAGLRVRCITLPDLPHKGDVSDYLDAGHTRDDLAALVTAAPEWTPTATLKATAPAARAIQLTRASDITVRPVRWLWEGRIPLGNMALLGGREGIGKSICAYTVAADITRGQLPGVYHAEPRAVIVAATEDSWEHTIVPRLMAAGADLTLVYRVDVTTAEGTETALSLPRDLVELGRVVRDVGAALIILDPLLSRLDTALDSHKDAEVRVALEPLVALANTTSTCVLGLIHVNKSTSSDVLTLLMGSRAFAAVARSVLFVMLDPEDDSKRLLGQAKNNLGRTDLPTLAFEIRPALVATTTEGDVWTGKLHWLGERDQSIREAVEAAAERSGDRGAAAEAGDWLHDYLTSQGGRADSAKAKEAGKHAGHTIDAIHRARQRLRLVVKPEGFPRRTWWSLPAGQSSDRQSSDSPGETSTTPTTTTTGEFPKESNGAVVGKSLQSLQLSESLETPRAEPTTREATSERY